MAQLAEDARVPASAGAGGRTPAAAAAAAPPPSLAPASRNRGSTARASTRLTSSSSATSAVHDSHPSEVGIDRGVVPLGQAVAHVGAEPGPVGLVLGRGTASRWACRYDWRSFSRAR